MFPFESRRQGAHLLSQSCVVEPLEELSELLPLRVWVLSPGEHGSRRHSRWRPTSSRPCFLTAKTAPHSPACLNVILRFKVISSATITGDCLTLSKVTLTLCSGIFSPLWFFFSSYVPVCCCRESSLSSRVDPRTEKQTPPSVHHQPGVQPQGTGSLLVYIVQTWRWAADFCLSPK